ncbi:hypothetical protein NM208_g2966 [Fusarium decemcellulare]|uniref:Uncharacterized protein n=1 Tax=Fusarium decemcellulare TaxID=57161 RepID=A0ACC1SQV5_9HYPO|nr:hypothetical protein NM208_g2966 [Fusarium decemcellulare]
MEATYQSLAQRIQQQWARKQSAEGDNARLLVALAGAPGSSPHYLMDRRSLPFPPMAFHFPLSTLRSWPNATEALARRGAPWTFDGHGLVAMVHTLRRRNETIVCPTFDHAVKDPVDDGVMVRPNVQVCILEGNYLLSDEAPWKDVAGLVDDRWYVHVEPGLARKRIALRHIEAGIETTLEKAFKRAEENDMVNGEYVASRSRGRYDLLIESVEEA